MTIADTYLPVRATKPVQLLYHLSITLAGSALIALSAQASFYLPFSPVPITGQTLGVLLVAAALGRLRGVAAVAAYLAEGFAGLPVFAAGAGGPLYLASPTAGYLFGFLLLAFLVGTLADRGWDRSPALTLAMMGLGTAAMFIPGLVWLGLYVGAERVLALGLWPFVVGDLLKIVFASAVLPAVRKFV
jgi:biotin transport system substrate-specific component